MTTFASLQHATYTEAEWTAWNGILLEGQLAFSSDLLFSGTDQPRFKIGNGTSTWTTLDYVPDASASSGTSTVYLTARNTTGVTITKGQVVYVNGAVSSTPTIALARSNAEATSFDVGVASFDIPNNTNVADNVTIVGTLTNIDTSAFTAGDKVYVSSSTAGALQNTSPSSPNFTSFVGHILYSHASNGILLVAPAKVVISQNTSLGTSKIVTPSENAVKQYADAIAIPKLEIMTGSLAVFSPSDSTTTYIGTATPLTPNATSNVRQFQLPTGTVKSVWIWAEPTGVLGSNENVTYYLRNITTATSSLLGTVKYDVRGNATWTPGLSISIANSTDYYSVEIVNPAFATNPTNCYTLCKFVIY